MCTGAEGMNLAGALAGGASNYLYSKTREEMARADAAAERDAAQQASQVILRATARRRSEARAATAASGARVDANSLMVEQDIVQAGETDAAMTILGAERRARTLETSAKLAKAEGQLAVGSSLFEAGYGMRGWRGIKGADYSATGADIRARR